MNMGSITGSVTEKEVEDFANSVLASTYPEKTWDWTPAEPSINLVEKFLLRRSVIGLYPWQAKEEVLHEIAHFKVQHHGSDFWRTYADLVIRFLGDWNFHVSTPVEAAVAL